jgi:predicted DNA-binding WGR domain protein
MGLVVEPASGDLLLAVSRREGTQVGVWRLHEGQVSAVALGHEAVGFPATARPTSPRLFARRDGSLGALWLTRGPSGERLQIETTWDGTRFAPAAPPIASSMGYGVTLFDPARGTLVTFLPGASTTLEETRGGSLEQKVVPSAGASYSQNVEGCFSTRLGRLVYLGFTSTHQMMLETWDGAELLALPWRSEPTSSFVSHYLLDGAPFDADVVVVTKDRWFAVKDGVASPPLTLPSAPGWSAWAVDVARRTLWVAGLDDGTLFGTLGPGGTRPVAGHPWSKFVRSAACSLEALIVAESSRSAVVLGPDGSESERSLPESELLAALPGGALLSFSRRAITLTSPDGAATPIPRPDDWMDELHTVLATDDGVVHALGICESDRKESSHLRFDGQSWSPAIEGPRALLAGSVVGAGVGGGQLVVVQSRADKSVRAETAWFDGAWRSEPLRLGPGWRPPPGSKTSDPFVKAVGRDPITGHLLLVAIGAQGPLLAIHAAEGFWKVVATLALRTPGTPSARAWRPEELSELLDEAEFGLRAVDRAVVMVGATGNASGASWRLEGSFGDLLDALPPPGKIAVPRLDIPPPDFFALVKREEGSSKFWSATLEAATYTVSWGKRGAKGQSKSSNARTAVKARAEVEKKVEEKLTDGYELIAEGPEVARTGTRPAFAFSRRATPIPAGDSPGEPGAPDDDSIAPPDATADAVDAPDTSADLLEASADLLAAPEATGNVLGGPGVTGGPACVTCGQPMSLVIQLARHPERLALQRHAGLAIWVCVAATCRPWQLDGGANAAVLLGEEAPVPEGAEPLAFAPAVTETERGDASGENDDSSPPSKLGGFPGWLQGEERPLCEVCSDPMAFALQIDAAEAGHNLGDGGRGYVFVCPRECCARFLSQSA